MLGKILFLLDRRERRKLALLLVLATLSGLAQVAGVGSIMPFVGVLTNPELVQENAGLAWAYQLAGEPSTNAFLVMLGLGVLAAFVASNALLALTQWYTVRFAHWNQYRLSRRLLEAHLSRPYIYHVQRNSADAGKNILTETQVFTGGVLSPGLQAIAFGVTALFITAFLIWLDPLIALLAIGVVGGAYGLIYLALRSTLGRVGRNRLRANTGRFKAANEAFGAIKEVKAFGRESSFLSQYEPQAHRFAQSMAIQQLIGRLPRYLIEVVGIGSVLLIALLLLAAGQDAASIVPLLSVYAIASYRLFPAFQHIYQGASNLRTNAPVIEALHASVADIVGPASREGARADDHADVLDSGPSTKLRTGFHRNDEGGHRDDEKGHRNDESIRLPFRHALELRDVTFTYPGREAPAVRNVSLTIPRGASAAFVGETGAGKTTLADVILALLRPDEGEIRVDGAILNDEAPNNENGNDDNLRRWRANIGYVPQHIYLADDTLSANIAFGIPNSRIDPTAVERAARTANIHEFIVNELPDGYKTVVGERGIRLSGGQRQRIGIARALYHDPDVLVLDEATSALDNTTEEAVQQAIDQAAQTKTLIIIAHRLSTVRKCDILFFLEHGEISGQGPYEELVENSAGFREMARQAS